MAKSALSIVNEKLLESVEAVMTRLDEAVKAGSGSVGWNSGLLNFLLQPMNWSTQKEYGGRNRLLLTFLAGMLKAPRMEFATYKQWQAAGGQVRKGEKGFPVLFFSEYDKKRKCTADSQSDRKDVVPVWRYYTVFDVSQVEGVEPRREIRQIQHVPNEELDGLISTFAKNTGLTLNLGKVAGNGFYNQNRHLVSVASLASYKTRDAYYSTVLHECIHSTGPALGRPMEGRFGSHSYSEEEIVAEVGSMFLCQTFGLVKEMKNSENYIKFWSATLRKNPSWLLKGAAAAQKAADYFLEKAGYVATGSQKTADADAA